jgi:predicted N-acetyltransferase YhbS
MTTDLDALRSQLADAEKANAQHVAEQIRLLGVLAEAEKRAATSDEQIRLLQLDAANKAARIDADQEACARIDNLLGRVAAERDDAVALLRTVPPPPNCGCTGFYGSCTHRRIWDWLAARFPPNGLGSLRREDTFAVNDTRKELAGVRERLETATRLVSRSTQAINRWRSLPVPSSTHTFELRADCEALRYDVDRFLASTPPASTGGGTAEPARGGPNLREPASDTFSIRNANPGDAERVYAFARAQPELNPSKLVDFMTREELAGSLDSPTSDWFIAEDRDSIIGMIYTCTSDVERQSPTSACIVYIAVAVSERRKGVGGALYDAAVAFLAARGVTYVYAWAHATSCVRNFLGQRGFVTGHSCVWMDREIRTAASSAETPKGKP